MIDHATFTRVGSRKVSVHLLRDLRVCPAMVGNGTLPIGFVQRAAVRVLTNRIMLGELIDSSAANPWRNLTLESELRINKPLARRAAAESVVLLRNRGNTLPLSSAQLHSVAVVGPSAHSYAAYLGDYAPQVGALNNC